jgi:isocitrate/isopropylmalate dehydrogenase
MPRLPPDLPPDPVIEVYKKDVDITLIRENLKLTYTERALKLMELQRMADELRRAGREARERKGDELGRITE